jgi:hypothetical protein
MPVSLYRGRGKNNGPAKMPGRNLVKCEFRFLVVGCLHNQVIDDAMCFIDVQECAIAQTAHGRIVLFTGDIVVRFIQQFQGTVKAPGAIHSCIDWRMIIQVLAVVDRSSLDFIDGFVNFIHRMLFFFVHVMSGSKVLQMSARVPQISESMQVCRMPSRLVGKG